MCGGTGFFFIADMGYFTLMEMEAFLKSIGYALLQFGGDFEFFCLKICVVKVHIFNSNLDLLSSPLNMFWESQEDHSYNLKIYIITGLVLGDCFLANTFKLPFLDIFILRIYIVFV